MVHQEETDVAEDQDGMAREAFLDHQERKENQDSEECQACLEKRETEERKDPQVKLDFQGMRECLEKPDHQGNQGSLEKWVLVVLLDQEDFQVFQDLPESLVVKDLPGLKETQVLRVNLAHQVSLVLMVLLVLQVLKDFWVPLVLLDQEGNLDFLDSPEQMVYLDILVILE